MSLMINRSLRSLNRLIKTSSAKNLQSISRYSSESNDNETVVEKRSTGGFAEAFEKQKKVVSNEEERKPELPFATLFRKSKFIDLGDPEGKVVTGTIFHVVNDDLYIDFGWKFYCVCSRPQRNGSDYVRGSKVRLSIKDLELSTKFLGSEKDLTILEADAVLIGLISSPARTGSPESTIS